MLIPSYTNEFFARHTLSRNTKYKVYNESLSLKRKKDKSTYINSFYSIHTTEAISISLSQIPENNQKQAPPDVISTGWMHSASIPIEIFSWKKLVFIAKRISWHWYIGWSNRRWTQFFKNILSNNVIDNVSNFTTNTWIVLYNCIYKFTEILKRQTRIGLLSPLNPNIWFK